MPSSFHEWAACEAAAGAGSGDRDQAGRRGLTLIELVLAVVVLAVAITPLMAFFRETTSAAILAERQTVAYFLALERMEEVVALRHAPQGGYGALTAAAFPDENPVAGFAGYSRAVTFTEVSPANLSTPQAGSGYLLVTITVSYTAPAGSYRTSCLFCNLPED